MSLKPAFSLQKFVFMNLFSDGVDFSSKQSTKEGDDEPNPLPWTLHQSWDPPWSFLTDASRLEMYTFDKNKRFAKRENTKDRGYLPLFVKPGLAVGKVIGCSYDSF